MGFLRRRPDEPVEWRVIPSGDPRVEGIAQPGEEFLDPMLTVIDWQQYLATVDEGLRQQYLATINDERLRQQQHVATSGGTRRARISACRRDLALSDRRLLVIDPTGSMSGPLPLSQIRDVSLVKPRWKPIAAGEFVIRIEFSGPDRVMRFVEYSGRRKDVEPFADRLRKNIGAVRLAASAEHESTDLDDGGQSREEEAAAPATIAAARKLANPYTTLQIASAWEDSDDELFRLELGTRTANLMLRKRARGFVSVFSTNQGAGKTFLATNIAAALSDLTGVNTAIIELDVGIGGVFTQFGKEPTATIHDLMSIGEGGNPRGRALGWRPGRRAPVGLRRAARRPRCRCTDGRGDR